MRKFNRKKDETREINIECNFLKNADGSCLIAYGETKVICTASLDKDLPNWTKNQKTGWLTAEYGMLPGSTSVRMRRESRSGKQSNRSIEIQRLIGRSLRTIIDLKKLGGYQFVLDCDVIHADGGTRTASISGAFVAISLAVKKFLANGILLENPIKDSIAGVSCGIVNGQILVDLDYSEDSNADVDANFVFTKKSGVSEVQISGEKNPFDIESINKMLQLANNAAKKIFSIQKKAIN